MHRRARSGLRLAVVAVAAIAVTACGGDDDDAADEAAAGTVATEPAVVDGDDQLAIGEGPAESAPMELGGVGQQVIVEMHVVLGSDDVARSVASITAAVNTAGGGVASSDIDYAPDDPPDEAPGGYAVLVVKVPPAEVDRLVESLASTGTVRSINQSAQDVADQLVDLDVRIENARESVTNVRAFMAETENLTELVTLEAELTRRQTELEQLEAQQRNLNDRVAMATITIEVMPNPVADEQPADRGLGDAMSDGWDAFVAIGFGVVYVLAVLSPFLAAGAVILLIVWLVSRRVGRRPAPDRSPTIPLPDPQRPESPAADDLQPAGQDTTL